MGVVLPHVNLHGALRLWEQASRPDCHLARGSEKPQEKA
jgi:hypothetical protein